MKKEAYHVLPNSKGGWSVTKRGNERATRTFDDKENAEKFGINIAKSHTAELVVHKKDGSIQKRVTGTSSKNKATTIKKR